jgi:hypothetical protein
MALRLEATLRTFFDRKAVIDAVDKAERKVLSKVGAFTRATDRKSIKEKKGVSPPGHPPHAHTTYTPKPGRRKQTRKKRLRFRDSILFGYDAANKSVVIGAYLFDRPSRPTVPELLEKGGRHPETGEFYRARPHTLPAFRKELRDGLPKILKDCVSK